MGVPVRWGSVCGAVYSLGGRAEASGGNRGSAAVGVVRCGLYGVAAGVGGAAGGSCLSVRPLPEVQGVVICAGVFSGSRALPYGAVAVWNSAVGPGRSRQLCPAGAWLLPAGGAPGRGPAGGLYLPETIGTPGRSVLPQPGATWNLLLFFLS